MILKVLGNVRELSPLPGGEGRVRASFPAHEAPDMFWLHLRVFASLLFLNARTK